MAKVRRFLLLTMFLSLSVSVNKQMSHVNTISESVSVSVNKQVSHVNTISESLSVSVNKVSHVNTISDLSASLSDLSESLSDLSVKSDTPSSSPDKVLLHDEAEVCVDKAYFKKSRRENLNRKKRFAAQKYVKKTI